MRALLLGQLVLVLTHDAAARGQLRLLERFAERTELVVALGPGNALSDSAREALRRWPALVAVELHFPLNEQDAGTLRKLGRLAVRLPATASAVAASAPGAAPGPRAAPIAPLSLREARRAQPTLALLGPALVRVERAAEAPLAPGPCPGSKERVLPDGASELRLESAVSQCDLDWLRAHLEPHPEPPGELPAEMLPPAPSSPRHE